MFMLVGVVLAGFGFVGYSSYTYRTATAPVEKTVMIQPGGGARVILAQLHEAGLTPAPIWMAVPMYSAGANRKLKAGEYHFEAGATPAQIIGKITRGEVEVHKLTIPEGWNSYQLRAALEGEPLLTGDLPIHIPEGSAFPDTMHFARDEPRAAVLARMQKAQSEVLAKLWETRAPNLPVTTPEEALILASVVEKETGVADERSMVAGVFTNRLRMGMPLQSDPTVAYGIMVQQGGAAMSRALTTADLRRDTPYNSYTRTGLPPTPICHPGLKAIEAALNPTATDALYFVATGNGGHHFAATLAEHNQNVAAYRKSLRQAAQ